MRVIKIILPILILLITSNSKIFGQSGEPLKSIISLENQYLIEKVDNRIRIIAQQNRPVSIDQLNATFQKYHSKKKPIEIIEGKGYFIINPDSIGIVEIHIKIGNIVETKTLRVKPIKVVGRLSRHRGNSDIKIDVSEFIAQKGITANLECYGIEATCSILEFQTIRISNQNQIERRINKGDRFEEETRELIMKAESGDIYIFRQIKYKCLSLEKSRRLDDMIFEIE